MGRTIKKTIKKGSSIVKLPSGDTPGTPQSMAVISSNNRVVVHNKGNNNNVAYLKRYSAKMAYTTWSTINYKKSTVCGHCNGACYCNKNSTIYVTGYAGNKHTNRIVAFDSKTLEYKYMFDLPVGASGIAYDRYTGQFYVGKGKSLYVFPYEAFQSGGAGARKKYKKYNAAYGGNHYQDIGGDKGVIYRVITQNKNGTNYVDAYNAYNGKYLGSIKIGYGECESIDIDEDGNLHFLTATNRALHKVNWRPASLFVGAAAKISNSTFTAGTARQAFVAKAKEELKKGVKESGNNNVKYNTWFYGRTVSGSSYPWCAVFIAWCANKALGNNKTIPKDANDFNIAQGCVNNGGKWIKKASKGPTTHVGIVEKVSNGVATTIEGNHGDKVGSRTISVPSKTKSGDLIVFYGGSVGGIARPNWPGGNFVVSADEYAEGMMSGTPTLQVSPQQLYSSENYKYIEATNEESEFQSQIKSNQKFLKDVLNNTKSVNLSSNKIVLDSTIGMNVLSASNKKNPRTRFQGDVFSSKLPILSNEVEAPYVKLIIGGVSIGTYKNNSAPNYINGLSVKKTNGSLNEYTINLIHQIYPGDNPNYIDNLISANGYNKIVIEYGDAEGGVSFNNVNALLTGVKSNFDFFNNCINYTLTATSSSIASSVVRRNYPAVTAQPSSLIRNMLYTTRELLEYFPGMENRSLVESKNLIPSNDIEVELDSADNCTPLNYLNILVSSMTSNTSKNNINDSVYYLNINDDSSLLGGSYFQIKQIKTNLNRINSSLIYEVDVGYPENDIVYDFTVNTDYAWPLAYEYSGGFNTYNYNIDNAGNLTNDKNITSNLKSITNTKGANVRDKNWWTNITEFPITATLTVKGLSTYTLLLNYIKINVLYFGAKRSTSGMYIIVGQEDSLSGNGFKTKLDLLRVGGDNQYLTVDARVRT